MAFNTHSIVNRESDIWQTLWAWPKIELHRHLEGSIRLATLIEVAQEYGIPLPAYTVEQLRPHVQVTSEDEANSAVFLGKFDMLRKFYCSMDIIRRITREAIEDAAHDNVRYMELRFTPHALAEQTKLCYEDVIAGVAEVVAQAQEDCGVRTRLIISVNRHESVTIAEKVLDATLEVNNSEIVALDLAGQEANHAAAPFRDVFLRAKDHGLFLTVHAGEWDGAANVREAIEVLEADRIGHGVRAVEDSEVVQLVRQRRITLEVCPTSNMQSGVAARLEQHPLIDLNFLRVPTTINTDDPSLSNITLTDELVLCHMGLGLPLGRIKSCVMNAVRAAFLPEDERNELNMEFRAAMGLDDTILRPPW
ncbi:MAG: adenosine deaminase [Anaerolineae bacterium]|nr:adenosine deaminase [Anaerolineae bacterium]